MIHGIAFENDYILTVVPRKAYHLMDHDSIGCACLEMSHSNLKPKYRMRYGTVLSHFRVMCYFFALKATRW